MRKVFYGLLALSLQTSLSAFWSGCDDIKTEYSLIGEYRVDELGSHSELFQDYTCSTLSNNLIIKDINIFEIGAGARWVLYDQWLFKANLLCGITNHGTYTQLGVDGLDDQGTFNLHVKKGNSRDASAAIGYVFVPLCDWEITPLIGLSYDYLRVKMRDNDIYCSFDPNLDGLTYKSKWNGPWIGLDTRYIYSSFQIDAGYEYHWADFHGNWSVPKHQHRHPSFSDIRQSHNAYGNVGYITLGWNVSNCVYAGFEFKCQYWKAKSGDENRQSSTSSSSSCPSSRSRTNSSYSYSYSSSSSSCSSSSDRIGKLKSARWKSYSIALELINYF